MNNKRWIAVIIFSLIAIIFAVGDSFGFWWALPNAKVVLRDCVRNCVITGTLRFNPLQDNYYLVGDDWRIWVEHDNWETVTFNGYEPPKSKSSVQ